MLNLFRQYTDWGRTSGMSASDLMPLGTQSYCELASGRSAIAHLARQLPEVKNVLLPAYVAEGVVQPFRAAGVTIHFYRLHADMRPDLTHVAQLLDVVAADTLFVLVHYFGFACGSSELDALLASFSVRVLEDCAHAPYLYQNKAPSGPRRFFLYSFNKFLPLADLAILASADAAVDVALDHVALPHLPQAALDAYAEHLNAAAALSAARDNEAALAAMTRLGESYERYYPYINEDLKPCQPSAAARQLLARYPFDWMLERRRANADACYQGIHHSAIQLLRAVRMPSDIPFCIPLLVPRTQRQSIQANLWQQGISLATLQDKWNFIPREEGYCFEEMFINSHLLLPINEFLSPADMQYMINAINQVSLQ